MKKSYLQRKTPLRAKTPLQRGRVALKRTKLRKRGKSPLAKAQQRLWQLCKEITRAKYGNICYTCGATDLVGSNWHTAHFIPKSVCSAPMKYDLDNLRPCCYRCNISLSGNWVAFEAHLIVEKGRDFPDELKRRNQELSGGDYKLIWYLDTIKKYEKIHN